MNSNKEMNATFFICCTLTIAIVIFSGMKVAKSKNSLLPASINKLQKENPDQKLPNQGAFRNGQTMWDWLDGAGDIWWDGDNPINSPASVQKNQCTSCKI